MYADLDPCSVCGSPVELRPHTAARPGTHPDGPTDERVCTNADCPTRHEGPRAEAP